MDENQILFVVIVMLEDLLIYKKYNDFIYYVYILLDKIPKYEKTSIGIDIRRIMILNLRLIIMMYKKKRYQLIIEIDTNLLILQNLVRVLYKKKYITLKNYKAFSNKIGELFKMIGGYYKKYQDKV